MSDRIPRLTQEQAARLMFAHAKAVKCAEAVGCARQTDEAIENRMECVRAEAAFAELIAGMTRDETE
jgi:hypothetical protein